MSNFVPLNPEQTEAVNFFQGPVLVLAGAGSGKTRVVTYRIVQLIESGVPANAILGLTFTNKAATEMKERVQKLTHSHVLICTFHSLGARILRESIHYLGYNNQFTIYDEEDTEKILKACLVDANLAEKKGETKVFKQLISAAKNAMQDPDEVKDDHERPEFPKIYRLYQTKLKESNALDFDDLLYLTVKLFEEHPQVLERYQRRWQYLHIDEYQDTNGAQYKLVRLLVQHSRNIFVVGDPDQSIYSWRGANVQNILHFERDYPGAKVIRLEQNYRSYSNILEAANVLISNNQDRYEKNLWSNRGAGSKISHYVGYDEREEARFVATRVRHHHDNHQIPLREMVVFYRTNAQSRAFEDQLLAQHIPYIIYGGISFYQRREIKDILAFLRMVHSPNDMVAFHRTVNLPKRGIGETTLDKLRLGAGEEKLPILHYCQALIEEASLKHPLKLSAKVKEGLKEYLGIIAQLKDISLSGSLADLVKASIQMTGYMGILQEDRETMNERKENLDELVTKAVEWEMSTENPTLSAFLEELSLKTTLDAGETGGDRVNIMTLHNGKGLEFQVTFIVGLEEDLLPHANSRGNYSALEEERRLCYVGMTRAKDYLYLTNVEIRYLWGTQKQQRPSRFLKEIPANFIERIRPVLAYR